MIEKNESKKTRKHEPDKMLLKIKKKYEKSFLITALLLCLYQIQYRIKSAISDFLFSGQNQKTTISLRLANKSINKTICKCHRMAEKCEYYKEKIEYINAI